MQTNQCKPPNLALDFLLPVYFVALILKWLHCYGVLPVKYVVKQIFAEFRTNHTTTKMFSLFKDISYSFFLFKDKSYSNDNVSKLFERIIGYYSIKYSFWKLTSVFLPVWPVPVLVGLLLVKSFIFFSISDGIKKPSSWTIFASRSINFSKAFDYVCHSALFYKPVSADPPLICFIDFIFPF